MIPAQDFPHQPLLHARSFIFSSHPYFPFLLPLSSIALLFCSSHPSLPLLTATSLLSYLLFLSPITASHPSLHYIISFNCSVTLPLSHFSGESLLLNSDTSPLRSSPMVAACSMKALFIDLCGPLFQYQPICDQETSDAVSGLEQHLSFHCDECFTVH